MRRLLGCILAVLAVPRPCFGSKKSKQRYGKVTTFKKWVHGG